MRRNPGFVGDMSHKIEGGVVTEFGIVTDQVTDIAPIRVFNALRVLDCHGTWTDKPNGLLADLTPLEGMNLAALTHLDLSHTKVSDAGLVHFKDCKNLTTSTSGVHEGERRGLAHFKDCKNLTYLYLYWHERGRRGPCPFPGLQGPDAPQFGRNEGERRGAGPLQGLQEPDAPGP